MQRRHARYPFLAEARETVRQADVDLAALVASGDPAVERGFDRVERAVNEGRIGDPHRQPRAELLSYPVARVLVSLVDQPALTRRYASAEARTAVARLREDAERDALRSADQGAVGLADLLAEFDLADATRERTTDAGDVVYDLAVTAYLPLAADLSADQWRLVNRALADGSLPVSREELFDLLAVAVERRVRDGLPFEVPDAIAAELQSELVAVRDLLADLDLTREIDAVVPDQFPPCVAALLDRARAGEDLDHRAQFVLVAFLANVGLRPDEVAAFVGSTPALDAEAVRSQARHVRDETGPAEYAPPSCTTMQAYGLCVDRDDLCETIAHPLAYYETALDRADDYDDWRERTEA
ncbi:MAG: DNA primase regulatory subunit PriL [Haloarculaceae archaeon]